jgi:hypothetical protein
LSNGKGRRVEEAKPNCTASMLRHLRNRKARPGRVAMVGQPVQCCERNGAKTGLVGADWTSDGTLPRARRLTSSSLTQWCEPSHDDADR